MTVFGVAAAVFLYDTEDRFFELLPREEAARVEIAATRSGEAAAPRFDWMAVYSTPVSLPAELRWPRPPPESPSVERRGWSPKWPTASCCARTARPSSQLATSVRDV
ncbi:MAG: hypothetical protein K2X99_05610 [Gemmatimonadaceae bacterium]|nr:hypothetical protein [Gemmatimonadaceae bacterium]